MNNIKKILVFILENLTVIVAACTGTFLFFSYENREINELLGYIIAILTLIATSMLIEKSVKLSSINKHIKNIENDKLISIENRIKSVEAKLVESDVFMYCHASLFWQDALNSANSLFISGGSLYHVIPEKTGDFESLLKNGCKIEVIVVKPYSDAAKFLHKNVVMEISNSDNFSENTIQTLDFLLKYKKKYPEQLTIRLNDHVPAFGIFATYKNLNPRRIQANFFSEKVPYDKRLAVSLDQSVEKSKFAYDYFCNQIELLRNRLPECTISELEEIVNYK